MVTLCKKRSDTVQGFITLGTYRCDGVFILSLCVSRQHAGFQESSKGRGTASGRNRSTTQFGGRIRFYLRKVYVVIDDFGRRKRCSFSLRLLVLQVDDFG